MHLKTMSIVFALIFLLSPFSAHAKTPKVVKHVGNDIKYSFAKWPLALVIGGAVVAGGIALEDAAIEEDIGGKNYLGKFDTVAKYMGDFYTVDGAALIVYGAGKLAHDDVIANTGETLIEALVLTQVSTMGLKYAFHRQRPNGGSRSFPSGHASTAFAAASVLETLHGPAVGVPAFLLASLISFARLDSNYHFMSDIVFGAAWGSMWGFGTAIFHKYEFERVRIMPVAGYMNGLSISANF